VNYFLDLDQCVREWLDAREQFLARSGRSALDRYDEANQRLYVAFAEGWIETNVKTIGNAFHDFRNLLMQEADRGNTRRANYHQ
jgi:hypothetical protein